jgi:superfamily I DNA/RNA helicase
MSWLVPFKDLSVEQMKAVEASDDENRLIVGAPGSGKTLVLLHRAARLREPSNTGSDVFRFIVFTKMLKDYISSACSDLNVPIEAVTTYDAWAAEYFSDQIGGRRPWAGRGPDFPEIRRRVRDHAVAKRERLYDFVLVDEGQDLDSVVFETLCAVSRHVTVAADHKQLIYETGSGDEEIANRLGLRRSNATLLGAFRCSPYIVPLATAFIGDPEDARVFSGQTQTELGARETPVLYTALSHQDEIDRLVEVALVRLTNGERIAILHPEWRKLPQFKRGLEAAGLDVEIQDRKRAIDFSNPCPKLMTYHSAKGLTFDSVLLPRLTSSSFMNKSVMLQMRLMFVATTRATRWVYLSSVQGEEADFLERLEPLLLNGVVTAQRPGDTVSPLPIPQPPDGGLDIFA